MNQKDVIIIGAGAAGLMCAIEAGKRGRRVLVLDRNIQVGEKIRISGGGRCNFTNINANPACYISQNMHFAKSALARYTQTDFISLIQKYDIQYHERNHGQLFCDGSARQLIQMLTKECRIANVQIDTGINILIIRKQNDFSVTTNNQQLTASCLVIATGGLVSTRAIYTDRFYFVDSKIRYPISREKPWPALL